MAAPRLTFLYPALFASLRKPATVREVSRTARRAFTASGRRRRPAAHQRYGSANEPPPHLGGTASNSTTIPHRPKSRTIKEEEKGAKEIDADKESAKVEARKALEREEEDEEEDDEVEEEDQRAIEALPPTGKLAPSPVLDAAESAPLAGPSPQPLIHAKPLETVLNMASADLNPTTSTPLYEDTKSQTQSPSDPPGAHRGQETSDERSPQHDPLSKQRPPHISTPPYVHHFDTYGLVRRLEEGGWTQEQAITLMKAVRLILSENMKLAHEGLVSKSNVENESYLFSAACSELKTEIQAKRASEGETSRTDRTQLQHEVDILNQRMTQESATMKDELKGMFDDRKMFVRNDQRDMERKIQELNYRITVSLNSDSRSDVEGVRWIITKRAITALAICVAMILGSLKFASSVAQWEEEEKKQLAAARKNSAGLMFDRENSPKAPPRNESGHLGGLDRDEFGEMLVKQGDNPAFVSLG